MKGWELEKLSNCSPHYCSVHSLLFIENLVSPIKDLNNKVVGRVMQSDSEVYVMIFDLC